MKSDDLESVLQLNTMLTNSLDFEKLTQEFLNKILTLLDLELVALYLTRSYQYIQSQAAELEIRNYEQECLNNQLLHPRDELTLLHSVLKETYRARNQFLSKMSHELRTPLTPIIGFSQVLLSEAENANFSQCQKNDLERILKNGKHLLLLINDVLDLAKIEAGRMDVNYSQVNLGELLSSVLEETQPIAIEQKLVLRSSVEEGADSLETDPVKLRQILLHLVSNALKFTVQGEVTVTATRATSSNNEAERIAIAVKDTGIGIAPEKQARIFEAFYQANSGTTRKFAGTGLGLLIVQQLTKLLGGTLEVKSSSEQGSTFTVTLAASLDERQLEQNNLRLHTAHQQVVPKLPASSGELTSAVRNELSDGPVNRETTSAEQRLILVVDDNPSVLALITSILEKSHYQVVGVQDSLKVVEMVRELRPSAVVLDVMMPDLNGWQILHQLKTNPATASIPVIMLTATSEPTTGFVLGADEYLIKPFEPDVLLNILHQLVVP